jgi:hypothetical protein
MSPSRPPLESGASAAGHGRYSTRRSSSLTTSERRLPSSWLQPRRTRGGSGLGRHDRATRPARPGGSSWRTRLASRPRRDRVEARPPMMPVLIEPEAKAAPRRPFACVRFRDVRRPSSRATPPVPTSVACLDTVTAAGRRSPAPKRARQRVRQITAWRASARAILRRRGVMDSSLTAGENAPGGDIWR